VPAVLCYQILYDILNLHAAQEPDKFIPGGFTERYMNVKEF